MSEQTKDERLLTVDEAAIVARVSTRTIERWILKGAVRALRPSPAARKRLIPREDVDPRRHL
jgi:excisionase family DNA binding protein